MHLIDRFKMLDDKIYLRLAVLWTLITLYLSLISARSAARFNVWDIIGFDKLGHLVFYTVFSFLWSMGVRKRSINKNFPLIFAICFGIIMEICQFYLFNGRSFELYDILANVVGSVIGVILFKNFIN